MQTDNRLFDDFVKFVNGAAGTVAGMAREGESAARERAREWIGGLDFVSREEFDSQMVVLARTRARLEALEAKVAALEEKLAPPPAE